MRIFFLNQYWSFLYLNKEWVGYIRELKKECSRVKVIDYSFDLVALLKSASARG